MQEERIADVEEISGFLDYVDRLLVENPKIAHYLCHPIPELVVHADADTRARAYSCLGVANLKLGDEERARSAFEVANELAGDCRPQTQALVKLRSSAVSKLERQYSRAAQELSEALQLASLEPEGPLQGRILIAQGSLAFVQSDFTTAAAQYTAAVDALPHNHHLAQIATWNLLVALYNLDTRSAPALLKHLSDLGLNCRRSGRGAVKSFSRCMICWVEGYLLSTLGVDRQATRQLFWAAQGLFELGAIREAALCALDLTEVEPERLPDIAEILESFARDSGTPKAIAEAIRQWASWSPDDGRLQTLREHLGQQIATREPQ